MAQQKVRVRLDLSGKRIGTLVVLHQTTDHIDARGVHWARWKCKCDCGITTKVLGADLRHNIQSKTCGKSGHLIRLNIGQKFNRLTIIGVFRLASVSTRNEALAKCKCDCGDKKNVRWSDLVYGSVKSCGCLLTEHCKRLGKKQRGSNNPTWITRVNGLKPKNLKEKHNGTAHLFWREQVIKRDKGICKCCEKIPKVAHVHHIETHAHNENLRYEKSNGITFCKRCHANYHKIYGKTRNVNKETLREFLKLNKRRK